MEKVIEEKDAFFSFKTDLFKAEDILRHEENLKMTERDGKLYINLGEVFFEVKNATKAGEVHTYAENGPDNEQKQNLPMNIVSKTSNNFICERITANPNL